MTPSEKNFLIYSKENALDVEGYENQTQRLETYVWRKRKSTAIFSDMEMLYDRAAYVRSKGINNLEKLLKEFETNFTAHGGKVIWAVDEKEAIDAITRIFNAANVKKAVTVDSGAIKELSIRKHFGAKCDLLETSLREFVRESAGDVRFDVARRNNKEVAQVLKKRYNVEVDYYADELVHFMVKQMQTRFFDVDIAFTGANFLIADIGAVALSENEGNIARAAAFPKIHIVVTGYDKIISSANDLELLWSMFSMAGTGEPLTAYNHLIFGPKQSYENDGPEEMYVVVVNNRRDAILRHRKQRKALNCIRCGACSRYCPAFRTIGEISYQAPYAGPIGSVIVPLMRDSKHDRYLTYASPLSLAPEQHCPVRIPLNNLLLYNRALFVKEGRAGEFSVKNIIWQQSLRLLGKRSMLNSGKSQKSAYFSALVKNQWGTERALPRFAKKSFNEMWRENGGV